MKSLRNSPKADHDTAKNGDGMVARQTALRPARELPEIIEPSVRPFNHPAVATESGVVERRSTEFTPMDKLSLRDTHADSTRSELSTKRPTVVPLIGRQAGRSAARADADPVNSGDSLSDIMDIRRRERHGQRNTVTISDAVTLRTDVLQFSRPADTAPPFLAGTSAASRAVWSQSRMPRLSKISSNFSQIFCQVPLRCQRLRRRQQVVPDPYRVGMSFQGTPLVTTYQIPSRIWRSVSVGGRPGRFLRGFFGSSGASTRHSLSASRRMVPSLLFGENHTMTEGIMQ